MESNLHSGEHDFGRILYLEANMEAAAGCKGKYHPCMEVFF